MTSPLVAIIDDDEALCSSLGDLLRSAGYRAGSFPSAEAFLASPNLLLFDCVIADIHMPGMGGLTLARRLGQERPMTPVILITALPGGHLDEDAIAVGAQCLIRKPFETRTLFDHVQRSLCNERPRR